MCKQAGALSFCVYPACVLGYKPNIKKASRLVRFHKLQFPVSTRPGIQLVYLVTKSGKIGNRESQEFFCLGNSPFTSRFCISFFYSYILTLKREARFLD